MSIFSLRDIRNVFPDANVATLKNNLTNWLKKGYIERLKRDLYACVEPILESGIPDFMSLIGSILLRTYHWKPHYLSTI